MFGSRKNQRVEQPYSIRELADAMTEGVRRLIEDQRQSGQPAQYEGLLDIILRGKPMRLDPQELVDDSDSSPVLVMAGSALAAQGLRLDISLVVKARNQVTGTVTETRVVITPEDAEPPEERNIIYPPNPADQRPSVTFSRLAPRGETPIGSLVISTDAGDQIRARAMGLQ